VCDCVRGDVEAELPKSVQAHWIDSNLHMRTLLVTLNRFKWRQRTRVLHRWRSRVRLRARNRVRTNERNRVRTCARSRVRMRARNRVRMRASNRVRLRARNRVRMPARNRVREVVYECHRRCDRVRLTYDVGALAPKIVTRCGASPSVCDHTFISSVSLKRHRF